LVFARCVIVDPADGALVTEPTRTLQLELGAGTDADAAEVDALTTGLRRELLKRDVSEVVRP
jgi:hypothetical protein